MLESQKILIVDDDHNYCDTLSDILYESGYGDVEMLYDGAELLNRLEEVSPDLILLDVMMPHLGAISILDQISNKENLKNIPIIIVTGQKELKNSFDSNSNVQAFFIKPTDPMALVSKIGEILGNKQQYEDSCGIDKLDTESKYETLLTENAALKKMVAQGDQRFYNVVGKSLDGFVIIDSEDKIVYSNPACERIFGCTKEEIISQDIKNILDGLSDDLDIDLSSQEKDKKSAEAIIQEVKGKHKDASLFPVEISKTKILIDDKDLVSIIIRDVSERKRSEAERENLISRLTESNEQLERFAYVCSHDLKEPLVVIKGFSSVLKKRIAEKYKNDEKIESYLNYILESMDRCMALIADTLKHSSIKNNIEKFELVEPNTLIEQIQINLQFDNKEKNSLVSCQRLPEIWGNKIQIFQLFQNLISNGLKYNNKKNTAHVKIDAQDTGEYWTFSVADNGIGIEERYFEEIFGFFKRLHNKDDYIGTGIGLPICKEIVKNHKGKIWVESELEKGATFYFTIPKNNFN
jgi:PAS domain S-box-containing protein